MYKQVNPIADLMIEAEQFVLENDRALYVPFFAAAEHFCSERGVLLGGRVGVDLLLGRPITKESFMWDLYCDDTHNTAKALAVAVSRAVSAHVPARTTVLQTNIRHREFTLSVNARLLFKINAIERFRGTSLSAMISTDARTSYFAHVPIKCVSAEMQLIEIYHTLYTPAKFARWTTDFANESLLQTVMPARIQKTGGTVASPHISSIATNATNYELSHGSRNDTLPAEFAIGGNDNDHALVRQFACMDDYARVLIGDHAMVALDFKLPSRPGRPQFIVSADIDTVKVEITRLVRKRAQTSRVEYVRYQLGLTTDFQITKHTLYEVTARGKIPLMDVFNSAQFEMIPFIPHTFANGEGSRAAKIGNPWVILRFLHIDMWILNFIASGARNPAIERRIAEIKKQVTQVRERYISGVGTGAPDSAVDTLFPTANFVGVYLDENVVKKQMIRSLGENFPPYYPARESPTVGGVEAQPKVCSHHMMTPIPNEGVMHHRVGTNDNQDLNAKDPHHRAAGADRLRASAVNITIDVPRKKQILKKVFGRVDHTIRQTLERYHGTAVNSASGEKPSVWGVGKDVSKFALRHKFFLPYIPARVNTLVDFGCGSGLDLQGMKSITEVGRAICADVIDERDASARENSFVLIAPGSILPFANETIDMYMIFHVLHHMNIDLVGPIKDIVRTLVSGGLVLIKDHDVSTADQASNVDFEHLAYAVGADTGNLDQMMRNYGTIEPMTYYTAKEIISMFESAGCVLLKSEIITPRTYIYGAIFQKREHT